MTRLVAVVVCGLTLVPATASGADRPLGIAHRGSTADCRWTGNTVRAFRRCARAAEILEVDLRLSKDGRPVIIHDATLQRTTTATGRVADRTFARLRRIRTADGAGRIPSLAVLANEIRRSGRMAAVDVKVYPGAKGWRLITRYLGPVRSRVIFFSAKATRFITKAKANGFAAAHHSWPDQPAPTVAQIRRYGRYVWRRGPISRARLAAYRDAGIRLIRRAESPAEWERSIREDAWAINTDHIDDYMAWRGAR